MLCVQLVNRLTLNSIEKCLDLNNIVRCLTGRGILQNAEYGILRHLYNILALSNEQSYLGLSTSLDCLG